MARINTNVSALISQSNLARSTKDLNSTLQRLSSGLRINRGADDPAGLIASESLRSEMASITKAISNSERASNVIATAEGALSEVSALLINIKGLTVEAANSGALSRTEIEANQLQVDSAIESITRIANSTTFAGLNLLNGNLSYVTSGVDTAEIIGLDIYGATLGTQDYMTVDVAGVSAAQQGFLKYIPLVAGQIGSSVTLEIASNRGVVVIPFASTAAVSTIVAAINARSDVTGVEASATGAGADNSGLVIRSVDYGSDAFVSVQALPSSHGTFVTQDADGAATQRDAGGDVVATINGAQVIGNGQTLTVKSSILDMKLKLDTSFDLGDSNTFYITGGGAMFQLGPHINSGEQVNIGIQSVIASRLGSTENGFLNEVTTGGAASLIGGNAASAAEIIEEAISQISTLRGRLGAFERNTLDTNMNSLQVTLENVTSSESAIRDADFAAETSALTRSQILVSAGTSVLALANQTPQSVLALLQ
jgi:flagellin